jgi:hypothetical protein
LGLLHLAVCVIFLFDPIMLAINGEGDRCLDYVDYVSWPRQDAAD